MTKPNPVLLIVEDDVGLQRQLRWAYEGYEIVVSSDRAQAIDAIRRRAREAQVGMDARVDRRARRRRLHQIRGKAI